MVTTLGRAWRWWYRTDWAVGLTIFFMALIPRLLPSGMFMDPDSAAEWLPRTRGFLEAIRGGDPILFAPDIHPGVTLMWLISLGFSLWRVIGQWVSGDVVEAFTWVIKLPIAVMTSLLAMSIWSLARRLVPRSTAVVVAAVFALDPLYLVFSRYLHLDALVTGCIFSGLLAVWLGVTRGAYRPIIIGAVLLSLGVLTRFNALIAVLIALGSLFWWAPGRGRWKPVIVFVVAGIAVALSVWPAILFSPDRLVDLMNNRIGLALVPHEVPPNVDTVPWVRALLYPLFLITREFPLLLLAAGVGLVTVRQWPLATRHIGYLLAMFSLVYYGVLLLQPKDLDRYVLPIVGPLAFFAALGGQWIWRRVRNRGGRIVVVGAIIAQLVLFYRLGPYFQTYQNILTPSIRQTPLRTSQALDPAWGEGISEAVRYLSTGRTALPSTAAWYAGVVCYYGHPHDVSKYPITGDTHLNCPSGLRLLENPSQAEYLLLSRDQIAQRIYPRLIDDIARLGWVPEKVITINHLPIVYVYRNAGGLAEHYSLTGREEM